MNCFTFDDQYCEKVKELMTSDGVGKCCSEAFRLVKKGSDLASGSECFWCSAIMKNNKKMPDHDMQLHFLEENSIKFFGTSFYLDQKKLEDEQTLICSDRSKVIARCRISKKDGLYSVPEDNSHFVYYAANPTDVKVNGAFDIEYGTKEE